MTSLEEMADSTVAFKDEIVCRCFVKDVEEDTYNFDDRWVMIAPVGEFIGSSTSGEELEEKLTPEALETVMMTFHDIGKELPLDKDHSSLKQPLDRDTQAYGWIADLRLMDNAAPEYNGLYAKIKWTPEGKELVLSRAYRFLSPVFMLDGAGHPFKLVNVALTNRPNFDLPPIFNTTSDKNTLVEDHKMDIEKLKDEIVEAVVNALDARAEKKTACNEEEKPEEGKEEKKEEAAEQKEEAAEQKEEKKEEKEEQKEEKEEVIKPEVLNTVPTTLEPAIDSTLKAAEWKSLHGDELYAWALRETAAAMRAR